ncbi:nuclear transport factor 2 family protein [Nocardia sp. NPDC004711]
MADKNALRELIHYSAWLYDHQRLDELAALYADDAEFTTVIRGTEVHGPFIGLEAVKARLREGMHGRSEQMRHVVTNTFFSEETPDTCTAISYLVLLIAGVSGPRVQATGTYTDRFVRVGTEWRYKSKMIELDSHFR